MPLPPRSLLLPLLLPPLPLRAARLASRARARSCATCASKVEPKRPFGYWTATPPPPTNGWSKKKKTTNIPIFYLSTSVGALLAALFAASRPHLIPTLALLRLLRVLPLLRRKFVDKLLFRRSDKKKQAKINN